MSKKSLNNELSSLIEDGDNLFSAYIDELNNQLNSVRLKIAKNSKRSQFIGLYNNSGRRIKAKKVSSAYGEQWYLHEDEASLISERGKRYLPIGHKSKVLKTLGLREVIEEAPAWAAFSYTEGAIELGKVNIEIYRTGDEWGKDSTPIA